MYEGGDGGAGLYGGKIDSPLLNLLMNDLAPESAILTFIWGLRKTGWQNFGEWQQAMASLPICSVSQDHLRTCVSRYTTLLAKGITAEEKFIPTAFILDLAYPLVQCQEVTRWAYSSQRGSRVSSRDMYGTRRQGKA